MADNRVPFREPVSRVPSDSPPAVAPPPATPHYSYTPPSWNPQSGPPPTFALMADDPEYSRYAELGLPTPRGKFFSGFLTGVLITAIAAAALAFAYGTTINEVLNQSRAALGLSPTPAPPAASVPATPSASTPSPSAPAPAAPSPSAQASATAGATQAPIAPAPAPNPGDASNAYNGAAPPNTLPPAPAAMPSEPAMPGPQPSNQAATATSRGGPPTPAPDSGAAELAVAQRYLNPKSGAAEHAAAVPALWDAIQKGNLQAEVMLADLYARGDGVTKSCNQARVLLRAAAERGNSEASQKLALLVRSGCR